MLPGPSLLANPTVLDLTLKSTLTVTCLRTLADVPLDAAVASQPPSSIRRTRKPSLADFARVPACVLGGCLVLVVPDRTLTFDALRPGTTVRSSSR